MRKIQGDLKSALEKIQKEIAENIKNKNFKQEFKAKEMLVDEEKEDWKQVEWLFKKAFKLSEIKKFKLFNEIVDFMSEFYDVEGHKFIAMPLSKSQKAVAKNLVMKYFETTQKEGNVFVDSHGTINCLRTESPAKEM